MSDENRGKILATAEPVRAVMEKVAGMGFPMSVFVAFGPKPGSSGTLSSTHLHGPSGTDFKKLIELAIHSLQHDLAVMEAEEEDEDDEGTPPVGAGGFLN